MTIAREDAPKPILPVTSEQLLRQIRTDAWGQCEVWSRRARRWRAAPAVLGVLAMLSAGTGAAIVVGHSLTPATKMAVAVLAFVGATLAGVAAAAGAPTQSAEAAQRADRFAALHRWTWFALAELPYVSPREGAALVRRILDWNDDLSGVTAPSRLREETAGPAAPDPKEGNGRFGGPQWDMAL